MYECMSPEMYYCSTSFSRSCARRREGRAEGCCVGGGWEEDVLQRQRRSGLHAKNWVGQLSNDGSERAAQSSVGTRRSTTLAPEDVNVHYDKIRFAAS